MMQSLPIEQLQHAPLQSLWYLHKQPPGFDTVRMVLAQLHRNRSGDALLRAVDRDLYILWALALGLQALLIHNWLWQLGARRWALPAALVWSVSPASLNYATLLESTLPSATLVLWLLYEIWLVGDRRESVGRLGAAFGALYLTRTVFQWPFLLVLFCALLIKQRSLTGTLKWIAIPFLVVLLFSVKQHVLFGTVATTTFQGDHLCELMGFKFDDAGKTKLRRSVTHLYPQAAEDLASRYGELHNTREQCLDNLALSQTCVQRALADPSLALARASLAFRTCFGSFIRPSSSYQDRPFLQQLGWRGVYDWLFSGKRLLFLLVLACAVWGVTAARAPLSDRKLAQGFALALPVLYAFFVINIGNYREFSPGVPWVEANRLKFLVEPALYLLVVFQLGHGASRLEIRHWRIFDRWRRGD